MTENKVLDPFKPTQPRIPGVSSPEEKTAQSKTGPDEKERIAPVGEPSGETPNISPTALNSLWIGLTLAGALVTAFLLFGLNHQPATKASTGNVGAETSPTVAPRPSTAPVSSMDAKIPIGPGPVATTSQLAKAWSAQSFYFRDSVTGKSVPAMVVRLPGGALWGFSLSEPYGTCALEYVTDLRKLERDYGFTATHPMVGDPCNKTVFDLMRYGNGPGGLVRGEIAQGSGWRPPIAIEVRSQANQIVAVRMEP